MIPANRPFPILPPVNDLKTIDFSDQPGVVVSRLLNGANQRTEAIGRYSLMPARGARSGKAMMGMEARKAMSSEDDFAQAAFKVLAEKAGPILRRKFAERGVSAPSDLSRDEAGDIFKAALLEAAVLGNPSVDLDGLRRATSAMTDDSIIEAMSRVRSEAQKPSGAFDPAKGRDAGILFAACGLPVAPFDRHGKGLLSPLTDDLEEAKKSFANAKSAYVGYSTVRAPFYIAVTDCWNTMRERVRTHPALKELRLAIERSGTFDWRGPVPPFRHACILMPREVNDRISTIFLEDASQTAGSVMFLAGWTEDDEPQGAPAEGIMTVPHQLVKALVTNPSIPGWLRRPVGATATLH